MNYEALYNEYGNKKLNIYPIEFISTYDGSFPFQYVPTALWYYTYFSYLPFSIRYIDILKGHILLDKLDMREIHKLWDLLPEKVKKTIHRLYKDYIWIDSIYREIHLETKNIAAGDKEKVIDIMFLKFVSKNYKAVYNALIQGIEKQKDVHFLRQEFLERLRQKRLFISNMEAAFRTPLLKAYLKKMNPVEKMLWEAFTTAIIDYEKTLSESNISETPIYNKKELEASVSSDAEASYIAHEVGILGGFDFIKFTHDAEIMSSGELSKVYSELSDLYSITNSGLFKIISEMATSHIVQGVRNTTKTINTTKVINMDLTRNLVIENIKGLELEKIMKGVELTKLREFLDKYIKGKLLEKFASIKGEKYEKSLYEDIIRNSGIDPRLILTSKVYNGIEYLYRDTIFFKQETEVSLAFLINLDLELIEIDLKKRVLDLEKVLVDAKIVSQYELVEKYDKDIVVKDVHNKLEKVKVMDIDILDVVPRLEKPDEPKHIQIDSKMHMHVREAYKNIVIHIEQDRYFRIPIIDGRIDKKYIVVEKYLKDMFLMALDYQFLKYFKDAFINRQESLLEKGFKDIDLFTQWIFGNREELVIDLQKLDGHAADKEPRITDLAGFDKSLLFDKGMKEFLQDRLKNIADKAEHHVSIVPRILGLLKNDKEFSNLVKELLLDQQERDVSLLWQTLTDRLKKEFDLLGHVEGERTEKDIQVSELLDLLSIMRESEIVKDPKLLERDLKEILVQFGFILSQMYTRWEFLPGDKGPWDDLLIPDEDWDYKANPVNGFTEDPLVGKDKGKKKVIISVYIIRNVIEFMKMILQTNVAAYAGSTPEVAIKHFVTTLYDWLDSNASGTEIEGTIRDDYWRLFRLIRWYAEGVIINVEPQDIDKAIGVKYVNKIINDVIAYYKQHHANLVLDIDKVKGSRRRDISSKSKLLKKENHEYKKEEPPDPLIIN